MALTITNNSPSAGYIAWSDLIITLKDVDYEVADGNSNSKILWWDADNPTSLQEADEIPEMTIDDCIVFYNDEGTASFIPNATTYRGELLTGGVTVTANFTVSETEPEDPADKDLWVQI